MRPCYFDFGPGSQWTNSIVDLIPPDEFGRPPGSPWVITRINVPAKHRGQGHGTRMLKRVLDDADADGVMLELSPLASGPLDREALVAWYHRHGFEVSEWPTMTRAPRRRHAPTCLALIPDFDYRDCNCRPVAVGDRT